MAGKKVTSSTRSAKAKTTKAKTTRSTTTKRATKSKSTAKMAPKYVPTPAASHAAIPAPVMPAPEPARPVRTEPVKMESPKAAKSVSSTGPRPSSFTDDHYIHAKGPEPAEGTPRQPGKWMMFVSRSRVDTLWDAIRHAVERGRLGHAAKVSTALPDPLSPDPKKHMICVYTVNENDPADVRRVRDALRGLGVTWKIPYKSDALARAGQYEGMGGPAAKYYE